MGKIILLVLGLLLVWWILKSYRRRVDGGGTRPPAGAGEDMVRCEQCGVHLPRSESIATQDKFFCSAEHQREHQSRWSA